MARRKAGPPRAGRMQDFAPKTRPHKALLLKNNFVAWVLVDNRAVEVHARTETEGGRRVAGKIVAKEGLEFAVGFRDERGTGSPAVAVDVVVDGVVSRADREIFRPDSFSRDQLTYTWRGRKDTSGTIRHYLFKPLSLTDDADLACEDERVVKSIGTIQLRICRIDVTGEVAPAVPEFVSAEPPTLHEMSKKARVSHQAGLGPAQPHVGSSRSTFRWVDQPESPFLTFEFSYLSRTLLELEGVIAPEPAPIAAATPAEPKPADRKPRRPSSSSASAGTPPPRSSTKPNPKRRESSAAAVSAMLLPTSPSPPPMYPKLVRQRSDPLEVYEPPPRMSVRGAAAGLSEKERLEKLERENKEMKAELERLRQGRLAEAQEEEREREPKRRRSGSLDEAARRAKEKGKGKAKAVEEVIIIDSDDSD